MQLSSLSNTLPIMAKPYSVTSSKLGVVTKLFTKKFICKENGIKSLNDKICEKLHTFYPDSAGFQYIVGFNDNTHFENTNLDELKKTIDHSGKITDRLVLNWAITHQIDGITNELTLIIRISNPVNPLMFLQAALSKSPQDIDNFEFEYGSVSVSVTGGTQMTAEELFEIVGKWIDGCPQP